LECNQTTRNIFALLNKNTADDNNDIGNNTSNGNPFHNSITNANNIFPNTSNNPFENILKAPGCTHSYDSKNVNNPFANNKTTASIVDLLKNVKNSTSDEDYDSSDINTSDSEYDDSQTNNIYWNFNDDASQYDDLNTNVNKNANPGLIIPKNDNIKLSIKNEFNSD